MLRSVPSILNLLIISIMKNVFFYQMPFLHLLGGSYDFLKFLFFQRNVSQLFTCICWTILEFRDKYHFTWWGLTILMFCWIWFVSILIFFLGLSIFCWEFWYPYSSRILLCSFVVVVVAFLMLSLSGLCLVKWV